MFCTVNTQQQLCCFSWTKKHANKMINVIDGGNYYWCLMFCFQAVYSRLCGKAYYAAIKLYHFYQFLIFCLQLDAACAPYCKVKIKSLPCSTERVGGCSSAPPRPWARRWRTTVCDTWPVRRHTYSYLPSHKAWPPIGWYHTKLYCLVTEAHVC